MLKLEKNSTLYETHKQGNPVRLLTTGCNAAIENLSRFIGNICAPLSENMRYRIRDTSHLLDIIDAINEKGIPDEIILVSFELLTCLRALIMLKKWKLLELALNTRDTSKP